MKNPPHHFGGYVGGKAARAIWLTLGDWLAVGGWVAVFAIGAVSSGLRAVSSGFKATCVAAKGFARRVFASGVFSCLVLGSLTHAAEARWEWDAEPPESIAGYRLYWGPASRQYTNVMVLWGPWTTNACVEVSGKTFFALTLVNWVALEGPLSLEAVYEPLWLITERSIDGVLWEPATTNEVPAAVWPMETFRVRIER